MPVGYLSIITAAGLTHRRSEPTTSEEPTEFVVMIPAHDEAVVIGETLDALAALDYPTARFTVHVVADNCSDTTASVVTERGWTVHERFDTVAPGKGPALNWLFDLLDMTSDASVAVVLDADSIVDPLFLRALDEAFRRGAVVAQGQYLARQPELSAATGFRFAALACRHHLRPLGRNRLGCSAGLYGNGMAFRMEVLRRHRWSGHLVEDAEMQIELLLHDGIRVAYVPEATLVAEMPTSEDDAISQNERWERGRVELARDTLPRLGRALVSRRRPQRRAIADAIADQLVPPVSVLAIINLAAVAVAGSMALGGVGGRRRLTISVMSTVALFGHVMAGMITVDAPRSAYLALLDAPRQVGWKMRLWLRSLQPGREVAWKRTRRNAEA